jgi:hypothetical protein
MDFDNLVPFGQIAGTDTFADVGDVSKGRACGCICPSCRTPLVARHGAVKAWHFAHASRGAYDQTANECGYSFEVSARLMALQLLRQGMTMAIPDCYGTLDGDDFDVAPEQSICLDAVAVETPFSGVTVDALAMINGAPFVIYLTHAARGVPEQLRSPSNPMASVIAVDVSALRMAFSAGHALGKRYTDILASFLAHDDRSKKWIFHPDLPSKRARAMEKQAAGRKVRGDQPSSTFGFNRQPLNPQYVAALVRPKGPRSWCVRCQIEWDTPERNNRCPRCKSDRQISAL